MIAVTVIVSLAVTDEWMVRQTGGHFELKKRFDVLK